MKTVISDLDGTLLDNGKLSLETLTTLKNFQKNHRLVLATGRNFNSVKNIVQQLEMDKYQTGALILLNGLAFYDFKDKETISLNSFDNNEVIKILKKINKLCFRITIVANDKRIIIPGLYDKLYQVLRFIIKHKPIELVKKQAIPDHIDKIELWTTTNYKFFFNRLKRKLKNYEVVKVSKYWIEILPQNTNKVNQVKYLVNKYHISLDDLYIFGDGENDIKMLQYAKNSYAPKNAMESVKQVANYRTLACNQSGVAKIIKQII